MASYRRTEYTRDTQGRVTACNVYLASDAATPAYSYTYTYNTAGKMTGYTCTTPNGTKTVTFTYATSGEISQVLQTTT